MYHINLFANEKYYLRLLLTIISKLCFFKVLRIVDSRVYTIFKEICVVHELLQNDDEWVRIFKKTIVFSSSLTLRQFFVIALFQDFFNNFSTLWLRFCEHLCNNLKFWIRSLSIVLNAFESLHLNYDLYLMNQQLRNFEKNFIDFQFFLYVFE